MVDEATARRVAAEEHRAYKDCIKGSPAERERAERLGLSGIVEGLVEGPKNWTVLDYITHEVSTRPFKGAGRTARTR